MKLYATTTSERASKGQGGNEYLHIEITNDKDEIIADIAIKPEPYNERQNIFVRYDGSITHVSKHDMEVESNGLNRKGEKHIHNKDCYMECMSKLVNKKGEKQKTANDYKCGCEYGYSDPLCDKKHTFKI